MPTLDKFTRAYLECVLWAETDNSDEQGGEPLDENYDIGDFADEALEQARKDCLEFQGANLNDIMQGHGGVEADGTPFDEFQRAGHDFWLTRRGHGAGFWDVGWPDDVGERLTVAAKAFGNVDVEVGDDGMLYFM